MGKTKITNLLSLSDLYAFYVNNGVDVVYDSKKSNSNLIVHLDGEMSFSNLEKNDSEYDPDLFKAYVNLEMCHTNVNDNETSISENAMTQATPSAYNMPILGYIYKDKDDKYQFAGHEMYEDEDGEIVYEEIPVGVIAESANLHYETKDNGKKYLCGQGILWKGYNKAYDILVRDTKHFVSIEIAIDKMSYNAKTKILDIEEYHFKGVTILGNDIETGKPLMPGMEGANITLADFSKEENILFTQDIINEITNRIYQSLKDKQIKEGGNEVDKFNELLQKYNKTVEDITFDYEGLSDEELEAKFAEVFDSTEDSPTATVDTDINASVSDNVDEANSENTVDNENTEGEALTEGTADNEFSLTISDGSKTFSLSYSEIRSALYALFNDAYGTDEDWYGVYDVYDDNTAIFENWCNGKFFRCSFANEGDSVKLTSEPEEVFSRFVTESEKVALDMLQSNYDEVKKELEQFKIVQESAEKEELFAAEYFSVIAESKEFEALKKDAANMSLDEVKTKADEILLNYYKSVGGAKTENFSANDQKTAMTVTELPSSNMGDSTHSRYEGLF